jgi:hypothetical protein
MARAIENWAFAMSPFVLAVGSQLEAFWAESGDTATTPIDKAAAMLVTVTLIKDLPDS